MGGKGKCKGPDKCKLKRIRNMYLSFVVKKKQSSQNLKSRLKVTRLILGMEVNLIDKHVLVPKSRSGVKVMIKYQGHVHRKKKKKMAI